MLWLKGLLSAFIGGAASGGAVMVIDPVQFNLSDGLAKLGTVCLVGGITSVLSYLKQSPIPGAKQ